MHIEIRARIVHTQFAVRGAQLEEVDFRECLLEELLFGHDPADGCGREESPAVFGGELVGTVHAECKFDQIFLVKCVVETAGVAGDTRFAERTGYGGCDAFPRGADRKIDRIGGEIPRLIAGHCVRVGFFLLVEEQAAYAVTPEFAVVGQRRANGESVSERRRFVEAAVDIDSRCIHDCGIHRRGRE